MPPWWLILLSVSLAFGSTAWALRRTRAVLPFLYVAAAVLGLACFEFYLDIPYFTKHESDRIEASVENFILDDALLGFAPRKNTRVSVRSFHNNELVFDAVFTIGQNGLRITPPHREGDLAGCVVFFGDSFTFGYGINDEETYPYGVGRELGAAYATYNFAVAGYGPHQILAALQAGQVEKIVDCRPTHFIYLFIPEQVARVAGLIDSYRAVPRYKLDENGRALRDGTWRDPLRLFGNVTLPRSAVDTFRTWQRFFGPTRAQSPADLALALAVLREAVRETRERFPESKFHIIFYDDHDDPSFDAIEASLNTAGVVSHRISSIVPDIRANPERYKIPIDGHPNERLDALLAKYLADTVILHKTQRTEPAKN